MLQYQRGVTVNSAAWRPGAVPGGLPLAIAGAVAAYIRNEGGREAPAANSNVVLFSDVAAFADANPAAIFELTLA